MIEKSGYEKTLVLVKALPQVGDKYGETVCCAGVTHTDEGKNEWRRMYPIRFRHLKNQFNRWDLIGYDWRRPKNDLRPESRHIQEVSIKVVGKLKTGAEKAKFLAPMIEPSCAEAKQNGKSLTLIRPQNTRFRIKKKSADKITKEKIAYERAASQGSLYDEDLKALEPCPFEFIFTYEDAEKPHEHTCQDWETAAMFFNLRDQYSEAAALKRISDVFGEQYPSKGMAFAMGTHSRHPIWLLIGVIRLDDPDQIAMNI